MERVDRYVIVRQLGQGGMGVVYAAHDPELDRTVAIKVLRNDVGNAETQERMRERLKREAQAMAQLSHPNVVAIHDVGAFGDAIFIAMEYVEGTTLAHWLAADGSRSHAEIIARYVEAARGLAAAHDEGIVHRDFKPENVMVGDDGRVRVTDFGLARSLDEGIAASTTNLRKMPVEGTPPDLTATGMVVGTPLYMAPEQYRGEAADARTDQFSFCVSLHAALYGKRPFAGDSFDELAQSVLGNRVEPIGEIPDDIPEAIRAAIAKGMAHEPAARHASMHALIAALVAKPPPKRTMLYATIGIATLAVGGAIVALMMSRSPAAPTDCGRDLAGVWDAKTTSKLSPEERAAGDKYAQSWNALHDVACSNKAQATDAATLQQMCLNLRRSDLWEIVERLPSPQGVTALSTGILPVDVCEDREYLRVLVGPPDKATRSLINAALRPLHELRAKLALGDIKSARQFVTAQLSTVRKLEFPAVRSEVLLVAGQLAAADGDLEVSYSLLGEAITDAEVGRHDLVEARARIEHAFVAVQLRRFDAIDAELAAARKSLARIRRRPELQDQLRTIETLVKNAR